MNGTIHSVLTPAKTRNSIIAFDFNTAGKLQQTEQPAQTASPTKKRSRPNSSYKSQGIIQWPGDGRDGWHKLYFENKNIILPKPYNHNFLNKILELDEKGHKVKFKLSFFSNVYSADELTIHEILQEDAHYSSHHGQNSASLSFAELYSIFFGRVDFMSKYLTNHASRLFQMLSKRYLGKCIRGLEALDMFGERALENKSARSASVISEKSTVYNILT